MSRRFLIVIVSFVVFATGVGLVIMLNRSNIPPGATKLTIQTAPRGGEITINGTKAKDGVNVVTPGALRIVIAKKGFETATQELTIASGESRYLGFSLVPNSPETLNWYGTHPGDQKLSERISSKNFEDISAKTIRNNPLIKELPYTPASNEYRIDYGQNPNGDTENPAIYITADTQEAKDNALAWIKLEGYDPTKFPIVYKSSSDN